MMMQGVEEGFDGAIYIGYHASTSNTEGVRAHTMSSASLTEVKINGVQMTEGSINALIAGHFGVPIIMISANTHPDTVRRLGRCIEPRRCRICRP